MTRPRLLPLLAAALVALLLACSGDAAPPTDDAAAQPGDAASLPCGGACGPGTVCELGRCVALNVPPPDAAQLDGPSLDAVQLDASAEPPPPDVPTEPACASLTPGNCCGAACEAPNTSSRVCTPAGRCAIGACAPGFGDCDGTYTNGCETNINTSAVHCGACHAPCGDARGCAMGACVSCDGDFDTVRSPACGGDDCDDSDQGVYPRRAELCNGRDDNCDGRAEDPSDAAIIAACQGYANRRLPGVTWLESMQCAPAPPGPMAEPPPEAYARDTRFCYRCFSMNGAVRCRCFGPTAMWACAGGA